MHVSGSHLIRAERAAVWSALQDPAVLVQTIPGCRELAEEGADRYRARVQAGVASITGVYEGTVVLDDQDPPNSYTLRATGQGAPGTIDATATVRLRDDDDGTCVEYSADAVVGGAIAGVGQRVLAGVARRNAELFFTAVDAHLSAPAAAPVPAGTPAASPEVAVGAAADQTRVYRRVGPAARASDPRALLGAAAVGALIALIGVVVGRLTARPPQPAGSNRFSWDLFSPRVSVRTTTRRTG